ncbi:DUF3857 domain-containing protein [Maribacter halichondriae]|uniref:transglutaminase domain-containing protein n=1 Tax=Maribacter halichondriae TaxID=2980554 RepID=UPI00235902CA|nr:DUF3857 domain-containing protein [Maribacter sp. Hal144]
MKKLLLILLIITVQITTAQNYSFGKVSKEELQETYNPLDSSAAATYLYKYRKTNFDYVTGLGFQQVTEVHERIKIYNKDGFDYATKKIALYKDGSNREKVNSLKAVTYNLENGKIVEEKLRKDGEFEVELSKYYDQQSFTMPKVKEGSVIEYRYKFVSPFLANVDEFVFQHDIPIKKLEAIMDSPEYFNFRVNTKGFLRVVPKVEQKNRKANLSQRVVQKSGNGTGGGVTTKRETSTVDYVSTLATYELTDIPALKEEPYVNGMQNYRSGVKYELSYTKFPNTPIDTYATDWSAVVKSIFENSSFGAELNKTGYFEDEIDAIVSGIQDDEQKIISIFEFVKSKVKWNGFYNKYTADGVKKAYKENKGNVAEINLMLTSMLRYAGLKADPVLVSTRKKWHTPFSDQGRIQLCHKRGRTACRNDIA